MSLTQQTISFIWSMCTWINTTFYTGLCRLAICRSLQNKAWQISSLLMRVNNNTSPSLAEVNKLGEAEKWKKNERVRINDDISCWHLLFFLLSCFRIPCPLPLLIFSLSGFQRKYKEKSILIHSFFSKYHELKLLNVEVTVLWCVLANIRQRWRLIISW